MILKSIIIIPTYLNLFRVRRQKTESLAFDWLKTHLNTSAQNAKNKKIEFL